MKARLLLPALAVTAFAVAGMACNRSGAKLRDAAAADLNCPPHEVHIIGASRTKDVTGCGQSATYKFEDGDWFMVSRSGAAPPPPGGAARPVKVGPSGPPAVGPAQPASTSGTPSMPPSSPPPPARQL